MIQLPPGFDINALCHDFFSLAWPFLLCFVSFGCYYIYKKVVKSI